MNNKFQHRPFTSTYRNQSHFQLGQQNPSKNLNTESSCLQKKKRPQSYRNISKIGEFMNDFPEKTKEVSKIRYLNVIQGRDESYQVPRTSQTPKNEGSREFEAFYEKNGCKMYKPVDQFAEYTDLIKKNSNLLRRGQFNLPIQKEPWSATFKRNSTDISHLSYNTASKYCSRYQPNKKFSNTIQFGLSQSIKERKHLKKQKIQFMYKTQKYIKPVNKTFIGYANEYEELMNKQRKQSQKVNLSNAMNRVLTMEVMGKRIGEMTQLYS